MLFTNRGGHRLKKRLRKKAGTRYHVLKRAQRAKVKRKGKGCVDYALVPIGLNDQLALASEGCTIDYPYATHWLLQLNEAKEKFPIKNDVYDAIHYLLVVYLCNEQGKTNSDFAITIHFLPASTVDNVQAFFNTLLDAMKQDVFWEN